MLETAITQQPELAQENADSVTGLLQVEVFTANDALPVADANVTVSQVLKGSSTLIRMMLTDRSGRTETIELPAPPKSMSTSPGNEKPFSEYNIRVEYPGFYTIEHINVPIFSGQTALQRVAMIPLPQVEESSKIIRYVETEPNL